MKGKRGLVFTLMIVVLLAFLIIAGLVYLKVRLGGVEFKTGNIVVKIDYEKEKAVESNDVENITRNSTYEDAEYNISLTGYNITD